MDFAEQLRMLKAAQGDPAKLALATVDIAYPTLPDVERTALKEALEAAAIPHWCDEAILATLLEISPAASATLLARLRRLTVVEPFPARGDTALDVHEATRLALRKHLAADSQSHFRALSTRAAMLFASDLTPSGRIEWIYHLLCADPARGADELEKLSRDWSVRAYPEDRHALAVALSDLERTKLAEGAARAEILLCTVDIRIERGEASLLESQATEALALSRAIKRPSTVAHANCLLGDVLLAQGKLPEAQIAFRDFLKISRRLVKQDPRNTDWQRELTVAHSRVGDVLQAQGKLPAARRAFQESLKIIQRLAKRDRSNVDWQRNLGATHSLLGTVLEAQGKLSEARRAFQEDLKISRRLVKQDPNNTGLQHDLAAAYSRIGGVLRVQDKLPEAGIAFREDLKIIQRLASLDPTNVSLQRNLSAAHNLVGDVLQAQGKPAAARRSFQESLKIIQQLAQQDHGNVGLQRDLAVSLGWIADFEEKAGRYESALPLCEEAVRIFGELVEKAPGLVQWAKEKENAESQLAHCRQMIEKAKP
jgi:tetratricopeptide (TPR) repeat protein